MVHGWRDLLLVPGGNVTGVLLMFYYRPTLERACINDILDLRDVTSFGILRELHAGARTRW